MKNILLILLLLFSDIALSQNKPVYKRAKITYHTPQNFIKLMQAGIPMDHGVHKSEGYIISDFSSTEIELAKKLGVHIDILIEDTAAEFLKQNKLAKAQKAVQNPTCPSNNGSPFKYPTPTNFVLGSMGGYLTYQEVLDNLDAMHTQYPELISARANVGTFLTNGTPDNSVTPSIGGNAIQWIRISDNPNIDENEPEILYDAIHHAREPASLSQLIYYMWYLLENYAADPEIKQIVDTTELYFIPVVNPDGYLYNQVTNPNGGGNWRKNRYNTHGVDNNRNYDHYPDGTQASATWGGLGSSSNTASQVYAGDNAFSEVETQAVKWFTEQHDFVIAMNNHSFGELLYRPYGYADIINTDEETYLAVSSELTSKNGYAPIRDFPFSGDSDDFMYGGTIQPHDKIFAFTPEIGTTFWPTSNLIDGLCKDMMYFNLTAAKMTHNYAKIESTDPAFIGENLSFDATYILKRLGLTGTGDFTVSIIPITTNITSVGSPKSYTTTIDVPIEDQITVNLDNSIRTGDEISYRIQVNGGNLIEFVSITKTYGAFQSIVDNNADTTDGYIQSGWSTTGTTFVSADTSITESPNGDYSPNQNKTIQLDQNIDLTTATHANVQFYAKWDIENNQDYVQFEVSIDNGNSWIPQCGKYTNAGSITNDQPTGEPLYDARQNDWVLEQISLSDYLGEVITIRFQFVSNATNQKDGFYFDDLKINTINENTLSLEKPSLSSFKVFPNPTRNVLKIFSSSTDTYDFIIRTITGQEIYKKNKIAGLYQLDVSRFNNGLYFITISVNGNTKNIKVIKY